jgi:broad specificity phosphatase PhoE
MKIYFVRHGSTDSLEKKISQPDNEPLNQAGLEQAKKLNKRFANTEVDLIISSPHTRAFQTAQAISSNITVSSLFAEVRKPTEVIGQPKDNEKVKAILQKIGQMYLVNPNWHYSDEENFEDLKKRGFEALDYIKSLSGNNIVIVSHGNFIALLIGLMLFGTDYPVGLSLRLKNFMRLNSAGVSICTFEDDKWKLETWNDTSHSLE